MEANNKEAWGNRGQLRPHRKPTQQKTKNNDEELSM